MTTTLEKVREKIISLVPEIVELKFGCEILVHGQSDFRSRVLRVNKNGFSLFRQNRKSIYLPKKSTGYEILGRPITLEDVLRAHCTMFDWFGDRPLEYRIGKTGQYEEQVASIYNLWHLGKPLNEQSEECVEFIGKVLGV